jgi:S1-C subfamily serine protease
MSADGKRVTYLSGGNMTAWNPTKMEEVPVTYKIEGPRQASDLAFHPVLPLAACIGPSLPLLFDRETGEPESDRLDLTLGDLNGSKIHRLWFSVDGNNLILDTSVNEVHYLYQAKLKLKAGEAAKIESGLAHWAADSGDGLSASPGGQTNSALVPLAQFDALKGGKGRDMTTRDIARWFTDSVVVINTGDGSGSGFVVGGAGYILTCAHCVSGAENISVSYRVKVGEKVEAMSAVAKIIRADPQVDLALLKIDPNAPLRAVRLAVAGDVQSGERVTVIGNPGLGKMILDYTVTEGVVSNARRSLAGQTYLQTSAAVNPGCSGGPMFGGNGFVIGLVDLKARIDGAAFGVPAEDLVAFLLSAAKTTGPEAAIERCWYDVSGAHRVDAQYIALQDDAVRLRREGKEIIVPLNRLSIQDQAFLRLLRPTQTKDK